MGKELVVLKRTVCDVIVLWGCYLTAESVQSTSLAFQGIDDIHGGDGLPLGVLGVCDSISDDILEENFKNSSCLLVDETRDTLDSTTASQTTDSGLGDTLDVITQDFAMTLCASFSKTFSSLATSRHVDSLTEIGETDELCAERVYIADGRGRLTNMADTRANGVVRLRTQFHWLTHYTFNLSSLWYR